MTKKPAAKQTIAMQIEDAIEQLPTHALYASPFQPRKEFDPVSLRALAAKLKTTGVLTPLIVREDAENEFEILCGERRWRAAKEAGLKFVPARRIECDDATAFQIAVEDNEDREPLNPIEQAEAWQRAIQMKIYGPQAKDLAEHLRISPATLSNHLSILKLPERWKAAIAAGQFGLTATHARPLLQWHHRPVVLDLVWDWLAGTGRNVSVAELTAETEDAVSARSRLAEFGGVGICRGKMYRCHISNEMCKSKKLDSEVAKINGQKSRIAFNVELWNEWNEAAKNSVTDEEVDESAPTATPRSAKDADKGELKSKPAPATKSLFPNDDPDATREMLLQELSGLYATAIADFLKNELPKKATQRRIECLLSIVSLLMTTCVSGERWRTAVTAAKDGLANRRVKGGFFEWITFEEPASRWPILEDAVVRLVESMRDKADLFTDEWRSIARVCKVTAEDGWIVTERFLQSLSLSQLLQIGKQWKRKLPNDKPGAIRGLLGYGAPRPMPNLLRELEGTL